ncbi:hypothetical protein TARUN_8424 [Trichoderma arundinaceum]|uniref:Uncharacterized protein n=1 Tax=Trichoderma arundinaceum TaxID=490622 RepID=A0A395NCI8_TRIAR|nr:hypothetical protein TARUN_8424 [Trichoderma arundinaceum]
MSHMAQRHAPWGTSDSFLPSGAIDYYRVPVEGDPYRTGGGVPHSLPASVPANHPPVSFYGPPANGSGQHVLLSPFNPALRPPGTTHHARPGMPPPRLPPLAPRETVAAREMLFDDALASIERQCHCHFCSRGQSHICPVQQLEQHQASVRASWRDEDQQLQQTRFRVEELVKQQVKVVLNYHRGLWADEKQRLVDEASILRTQLQDLELENQELRNTAFVRSQIYAYEHKDCSLPVIHHGSFQGNTPSVDGGPPPPTANQQSGRAGGDDGALSVPDAHRWPSYYPAVASNDAAAQVSAQTSVPGGPRDVGRWGGGWTHPTSPMNAESNGRPTPQMSSPIPLMSPMNPPLSRLVSPNTAWWRSSASSSPLHRETETRSIAGSEPKRSPKRSSSAANAFHTHSGPDGVSPGSSAGPTTAFAEGSVEGSPPSKRRRSLSRDYYIVANERGEEETQRLTMHAGHTPNHSPSVPSGTAPSPSGGSTVVKREPNPRPRGVGAESSFSPPFPLIPPLPSFSSSPASQRRLLKAGDDAPLGRTESSSSLPIPAIPSLSSPAFQRRLPRAEDDAPLERVESPLSSSPSSPRGLLKAEDDAPLTGPLMIRNIPAQDELFLATLNERLRPISQGQDALPRAVQPPVAVPAPLSAVSGVRIGGAGDNQNALPDNADASRSRSDTDGGSDGVHIKKENIFPLGLGGEDEEEDQGRDAHVKIEPRPVGVKAEDSDEDSDAVSVEPDLPIKFRSTCNFGAPFGRRI